MIGVDLFAGAGGLSLGARWAGIKVAIAVEANRWAAETYRRNHPDTLVIEADIRSFCDLPRANGRQIRVLFGGAPCQGFSTSNQRTRNDANPVNWLFKEFLRLVRSWAPEWVVFENVTGIKQTAGGQFLKQVLQGLTDSGYQSQTWILNAADHGVPQKRSRLFVIASLGDRFRISAPEPSSDKTVTVRDAIHDLPVLPNGAATDTLPYACRAESDYAAILRDDAHCCSGHLVTRNAPHILERYRHVPPGGNWSDIPSSFMATYGNTGSCHTGIYHRLVPDSPSVVIGNFRKNMLIHPWQDRGLSIREAARLQSFPDWYVFCGSIGFQQQQVGNAVPPLLASSVFARIRQASGPN